MKERLYYLDNLKVILIILVMVHHVGQAYGPTGGYWDFQSMYRVSFLGSFFTINASFFMGLFFLISAYFIPGSYDKHGSKKFVLDRLVRYGIPLLLGFFILVPLDQYASFIYWRGGSKISFLAYFKNVYFGMGPKLTGVKSPGWPELNFGHLWFIQHLLVYVLLYALFRWITSFKKSKKQPGKNSNFIPGIGTILLYSVLVAYLTGIIRLYYPIDRWFPFLYFIQLEPAHFASYFFSFLSGIWAYRNHWLEKIPSYVGWVLFGIGFLLSICVILGFEFNLKVFNYMFNEDRFLCETMMGMSLSFGSVIIARSLLNQTNAIWKWLSGNAYAAYIFHVPVIIFLQFSLEKLPPYNPLMKFLFVSFLSVIITFLVSNLIRKIPGSKRVFG